MTKKRKIQIPRSRLQVGKSLALIRRTQARRNLVGKSRVGRNPVRHRKTQAQINRLRKETQNGNLRINGKIIRNQHRQKRLRVRVNRHQNRAQVQKEIK